MLALEVALNAFQYSGGEEFELVFLGFEDGNLMGGVQPCPQVAVGQQIEAQHRRQVRKAPKPVCDPFPHIGAEPPSQ